MVDLHKLVLNASWMYRKRKCNASKHVESERPHIEVRCQKSKRRSTKAPHVTTHRESKTSGGLKTSVKLGRSLRDPKCAKFI